MKVVLSVFAALLSLIACRPDLDNAAATASAERDQTLESRDGRISIAVHNARFSDIIGDASRHPKDMSDADLTLLQYDPETRITLYVGDGGEVRSDAKTYFANLKSTLQADGSRSVRTGIATDNRMNYQIVRQDRQGVFNQYCIAIHETRLYTVCAYSHYASHRDLADVLKEVSVVR